MSKSFFRILSFFSFPAAVFVFSYIISLTFNAYTIYPWIDIPMHFLGGFSVAYTVLLFLRFFREKGFMEINNKAVFLIVIVSVVVFVAVLWEFYEFLKYFFHISILSTIEDTLTDLLMGLIGGLFGSFIFRNK